MYENEDDEYHDFDLNIMNSEGKGWGWKVGGERGTGKGAVLKWAPTQPGRATPEEDWSTARLE